MATESLIRMMETRTRWPSHKEAAAFSSSTNMTLDDEDLLAKGQNYTRSRGIAPNRSGSAPPSMEGSLAAIKHMSQSSNLGPSWASLSSDPGSGHTEEHNFNVKFNPQFHQTPSCRSVGNSSNRWRSNSFDDSNSHLLNPCQATLPTHNEETEDDISPQQATGNWNDQSSAGCSVQEMHSLQERVKIHIEDDSPDIPFSEKLHPLRPASAGEAANHDEEKGGVSHDVKSSIVVNDITSSLDTGVSAAVNFKSSSSDNIGSHVPALDREKQKSVEVSKVDEAVKSAESGIQFGVEALSISENPTFDYQRSQQERQSSHQNSFVPYNTYQQNSSFQYQDSVPQVYTQGTNNAFTGFNQTPHGGKLPSTEVRPLLQSSGFTPPLYASTGSYMTSANPYYSSMQPPGVVYSPQYSVSPYAFNAAVLPPFLAGYPPHNAVPLSFDGVGGPNFTSRTPGLVSGGSSSYPVEVQHLNKFYGQHGIVQPSFIDPSMQLHQPFGELYNTAGQADSMSLRTAALGFYASALNSRKTSDFRGFSPDHRPQHHADAGWSNLNQGRGISGPGSPVNMGMLMQATTSFGTPVLPVSPVGGCSVPGARNQVNVTPHPGKNMGFYGGWSGQRGFNNVTCTKADSFLEDLKSGKGRRFELSDIRGHVVEFSTDQHGSRFIQQKLESCNIEEKGSVFAEVLPHAAKLMIDVFGNYVIQKFFEYGTPEQRRELASQLAGQILPLSLQMYGCRVIQKALDVIALEQKAELVRELDGHVMRCVRDQNGNHVIQKCIESLPTEKIDFVISAFRGEVALLSMHPYGCRVIQRVLEHCKDEPQSQFIVDEILESVITLAQDQYGNYVTQHVLERGKPDERSRLIRKLCGQIVQLSQHKFASNVVEKCLEYGDSEVRELLVAEVVGLEDGNDNLLVMMKDQYANYVVQKILETCTSNQRDILLGRIRVHLHALRKYTYGKHIVARFEQVFGEEIEAAGSG